MAFQFANCQEYFPELIEKIEHRCTQKFFYRDSLPADKQDFCWIETLVKSRNARRLFIPSAFHFYANCFVSLLQYEIHFVVAFPPIVKVYIFCNGLIEQMSPYNRFDPSAIYFRLTRYFMVLHSTQCRHQRHVEYLKLWTGCTLTDC